MVGEVVGHSQHSFWQRRNAKEAAFDLAYEITTYFPLPLEMHVFIRNNLHLAKTVLPGSFLSGNSVCRNVAADKISWRSFDK